MNQPVPITRVMRFVLTTTILFVVIAGTSTYFFPHMTDTFFAWTINPPVTAAFIGGGYLAAIALIATSVSQRSWAKAEFAVPGVLAFSVLTLIATLLHLDRFHFNADPLPAAWAWSWFLVYVIVPPVLAIAWLFQLRAARGEHLPTVPWPTTLRILIVFFSVIYLTVGLVLFIAPGLLPWGWTLSPLTSRVVAAWLVGIGVLTAHGAWRNDLLRSMPLAISGSVYCILQIVNIVRFSSSLDLAHPMNVLFIVCLVLLLVCSIWLVVLSLKANQAASPVSGQLPALP